MAFVKAVWSALKIVQGDQEALNADTNTLQSSINRSSEATSSNSGVRDLERATTMALKFLSSCLVVARPIPLIIWNVWANESKRRDLLKYLDAPVMMITGFRLSIISRVVLIVAVNYLDSRDDSESRADSQAIQGWFPPVNRPGIGSQFWPPPFFWRFISYKYTIWFTSINYWIVIESSPWIMELPLDSRSRGDSTIPKFRQFKRLFVGSIQCLNRLWIATVNRPWIDRN